jgi:hypothetical protein
VNDLEKYLPKKDLLRLVQSREEAELVIEVLGRGRPIPGEWDHTSLMVQIPRLKIGVSTGPKLDLPADVSKTLLWYHGRDASILVDHIYDIEEPWWELEVHTTLNNATWRNAAMAAANAIDIFVEKNYELLGKALN